MFRKALIICVGLFLLLAFGASGRAQADATPTPDHMMMDMGGTPMPEDGHNHERIPANGAAVKIVAPKDGEMLDRDNVIVRVETTNWPLGETGHHFHLYVNGAEQGMSQGNNPALQARDLQPGENMIEVVLSNELHQELDASDRITLHYNTSDPAGTSVDASAGDQSTGVIITLSLVVVSVLAILGVGFALMRKKRNA